MRSAFCIIGAELHAYYSESLSTPASHTSLSRLKNSKYWIMLRNILYLLDQLRDTFELEGNEIGQRDLLYVPRTRMTEGTFQCTPQLDGTAFLGIHEHLIYKVIQRKPRGF